MENQPKQKLAWKITVPIVAILLVIGIVIYTGGFENFLKFLGIKASLEQSITLTTNMQMVGNSPTDTWLVPDSMPIADGASVFGSFSSVPNDPNEAGLVMPIYSAADPEQNTYKDHIYTSPAMDFGSDTPTLTAYTVQFYTPEGASLVHSYRTASSVVGLQTAQFTPVELALDRGDNQIATATAQLSVSTERYIQVRVEFLNDTFANRSAVYSWTLQYDPNAGEGGMQGASLPMTEDTLEPSPVTLDFTSAGELPDTISVQVLSTSMGVQPVIEASNLATEEAAPLYNLATPLPAGTYTLVVRAAGYETMVIPFEVVASAPATIELETFVKQAETTTNFDLNGDGAINSLDIAILIEHIGAAQPEAENPPLTDQ